MNGNDMLEEMLEAKDGISYNAEKDQFVFTMLDNVQTMRKLYDTVPVFREFVNREIRAKREMVQGLEHDTVTGYEVAGFLYWHQGEEYTYPRDAV